VQTVIGPVSPDEIGFTLPHEHIYARLWDNAVVATAGWGVMFAALPMPEDALREEIDAYRSKGGATIVDLSLPAIGRSPEKLRTISQDTGVNVVMGCGWYREPFYPPEDGIDRRTADSLAELLISEVTDGVGDTGVRPGIIGEIGANNGWVTALEERVHRAAARASLATGLALTTHSSFSPVGLAQLKIFEEEGVDPNRVVIGHCDSWLNLDYHTAILEKGGYVEFDCIGAWTIGKNVDRYETQLVDAFVELINRGYATRLLLSHDVFAAPQFRYYEGVGFTYIIETFLPKLRDREIDESVIHTITVENPARILTVAEAG
jgi:phosphotriesterase-related protein